MSSPITRRNLLLAGASTALLAGNRALATATSPSASRPVADSPAFAKLDPFIRQYLRDMNAPGLTLGLADRAGVARVAVYGYSDIERKIALAPLELFEIGSIGKSFVAISLLQLREEGKLDLHRPIVEYLPWLRLESPFAPITPHHLLTHTSGLPGSPPVFLSDTTQVHRPAYAPGAHFFYCNIGFNILGHLLWTLDGRELGEAIRERILVPLGMTESEPVATLDVRSRIARSYYPFQSDRPYLRYGRLSPAPATIWTQGDGCPLSTPRDMALYLQMLANRGQGPTSRLLTEESFVLFSTGYARYWNPDPASGYGYGIEVEHVDGHTVLSHSGGSNSFASSIRVDLDAGVAAFASINAMQGYRPDAVTDYALRLMRAQREAGPLPALPATDSPLTIANAADYAGVYTAPDRRRVELVASGDSLFLLANTKRMQLQTLKTLGDAPDTFGVDDPKFSRFTLVFGRASALDPRSPVVELGWGNDWYTNAKYHGPVAFDSPAEWQSYLGHYHNETTTVGSLRIVLRKGVLMVDGSVPLEPAGNGRFWVRDETFGPDWIQFLSPVNGKAMQLKLSGEDLWRVMTD